MSKDLFVYVPCDACDGQGKIMVSKLGALRKKAGYDQVAVAERLGLTRTSISNIEQGKQAIDIKYIAPLAEMYGVEEFEMYQLAKRLSSQERKL